MCMAMPLPDAHDLPQLHKGGAQLLKVVHCIARQLNLAATAAPAAKGKEAG